ncbi:LuxR C-terminal-related transcriptional regulator [Niabella terrae]
MNTRFVVSFIFSCFILIEGLQAQSVMIDSLDAIINNPAAANIEKIKALCKRAKISAVNKSFDQALQWITLSKNLHQKEGDHSQGVLIYTTLASIYTLQDSLNLAYQAVDSAQWFAAGSEDKLTKGRALNSKGWLEMMVENTDKAYEYWLQALQLLEGLHDKEAATLRSSIYHHLAAAEGYWKNQEKQWTFTKRCLDEAVKSKDADAISNAYLSMGVSFLYRYRKDTSQRTLLDSSKYYTKKVLVFSEAHKKQLTLPGTIGIASLNLANLYYEFYPLSYKDSAEQYLSQALKVGRETKNTQIIGNSYGILSGYALKENNFKDAEILLSKALAEIISSPTKDTRTQSRLLHMQAQVAEKQNNTRQALDYYKQYIALDKKLFDEEKFTITQKLEARYQANKKELALSSARQETAFTKKLNRYYLTLLIVGGLALYFLFRSYHFKLKTSRQEQLLLVGQKNEAKLHADLKHKESARLQAERKLMQERLDRLEKELLAGTLQVEEKNKLLQSFKDKLENLDSNNPLYRQFNRLFYRNHEVDRDYQDIKIEFAEIRPEFIAGLQQRAENKLTRLDLKYCSYILMGLTSKEIANKLNVEPKSIRMARYRIKQKLKLQKDDNLDQFISDLSTRSNT